MNRENGDPSSRVYRILMRYPALRRIIIDRRLDGVALESTHFATVYLARYQGKEVCVKVPKLRGDAYQASRSAVYAAYFSSKLQHPNVVRTLGVFVTAADEDIQAEANEERRYEGEAQPSQPVDHGAAAHAGVAPIGIVTKQLCTLRDWFRQQREKGIPVGYQLKAQLCLDIARALKYLNDQPRDLDNRGVRPQSIYVDHGDGGRVIACLGDFLAQQQFPLKWSVPGTDGSITSAAEVWLLGITMWEIMSMGQHPHEGTQAEVLMRIQERDCTSDGHPLGALRGYVGREEWAIANDCCREHPNDRPSIEEVVQRLEQVVARYKHASIASEQRPGLLNWAVPSLCFAGGIVLAKGRGTWLGRWFSGTLLSAGHTGLVAASFGEHSFSGMQMVVLNALSQFLLALLSRKLFGRLHRTVKPLQTLIVAMLASSAVNALARRGAMDGTMLLRSILPALFGHLATAVGRKVSPRLMDLSVIFGPKVAMFGPIAITAVLATLCTCMSDAAARATGIACSRGRETLQKQLKFAAVNVLWALVGALATRFCIGDHIDWIIRQRRRRTGDIARLLHHFGGVMYEPGKSTPQGDRLNEKCIADRLRDEVEVTAYKGGTTNAFLSFRKDHRFTTPKKGPATVPHKMLWDEWPGWVGTPKDLEQAADRRSLDALCALFSLRVETLPATDHGEEKENHTCEPLE